MGWTLLALLIAGMVGGLLQAVPVRNEWVRRSAGGLIALGFLGVLLWVVLLTSMASGALTRQG